MVTAPSRMVGHSRTSSLKSPLLERSSRHGHVPTLWWCTGSRSRDFSLLMEKAYNIDVHLLERSTIGKRLGGTLSFRVKVSVTCEDWTYLSGRYNCSLVYIEALPQNCINTQIYGCLYSFCKMSYPLHVTYANPQNTLSLWWKCEVKSCSPVLFRVSTGTWHWPSTKPFLRGCGPSNMVN